MSTGGVPGGVSSCSPPPKDCNHRPDLFTCLFWPRSIFSNEVFRVVYVFPFLNTSFYFSDCCKFIAPAVVFLSPEKILPGGYPFLRLFFPNSIPLRRGWVSCTLPSDAVQAPRCERFCFPLFFFVFCIPRSFLSLFFKCPMYCHARARTPASVPFNLISPILTSLLVLVFPSDRLFPSLRSIRS